jgi:thioredoxin reductase (NADPH)
MAPTIASCYRIVRAVSGAQALAVLSKLALRNQPVALIASDQRMPEMTGIELLEQARTHAPNAKYLLLTAYADTDVAIKAINDIGLDYYLLKPWDPPEERQYPIIDDLLGDWRQAHPEHTSDLRVVGHRWSDRSHDIKTFLARNHVPYRWYDIERDAEAQRLSELAQATAADLPLVLVPEGETLRCPSTLEIADALGLRTRAEQPLYDVCIVGGGPAGLAAAVYAASEGLGTVIVEREAPGGQAGQSASIENYLGFPKGLTGSDLTQRAVAQVSRFGAEVVLARDVVGFQTRGPVHECSSKVRGRSRRARSSWRRACPPGASRQQGSTSSPAGASTTAPPPARRANVRATTSTSLVPPTQQDRPRSTWPASPSEWCWWFAVRRSRTRCPSISAREPCPHPTSRCGTAVRWWLVEATAISSR